MKNKLKTHKGTSKRLWRTGSGKLRRKHAMSTHNKGRENVNQSLRRRLKHDVPGSNPDLELLIPYKK